MRLLVIGQGSMGRRRIRNLLHIGGQDLAAMEPDPARREVSSQEHGQPVFASAEEAWSWGPDALIVSTPPDRHHEYAMEAARRGLHFFTEASVVPGETAELIRAVGDQAIVAAPSCTMRFHPAVQLMKRRLAEGAIGQPLVVVHHVGQHLADWHPWEDYRTFYVARRETGAAREIVPFELNWMTYLFGEVEAVQGICAPVAELEVDIDAVYAAVLQFTAGVTATLLVDVVSRPAIRAARIAGDRGTFVWDFAARHVREWESGASGWVEYPDPTPVQGPGGKWVAENMYIAEMQGFLDAIAGDRSRFPFSLEEDERLLDVLARLESTSADARRAGLSSLSARQAG